MPLTARPTDLSRLDERTFQVTVTATKSGIITLGLSAGRVATSPPNLGTA